MISLKHLLYGRASTPTTSFLLAPQLLWILMWLQWLINKELGKKNRTSLSETKARHIYIYTGIYMKSGSRLCNAVVSGHWCCLLLWGHVRQIQSDGPLPERCRGGTLRKRTAETTDYITVNKTRGVSRIIPYVIRLSPFSNLHLAVLYTF